MVPANKKKNFSAQLDSVSCRRKKKAALGLTRACVYAIFHIPTIETFFSDNSSMGVQQNYMTSTEHCSMGAQQNYTTRHEHCSMSVQQNYMTLCSKCRGGCRVLDPTQNSFTYCRFSFCTRSTFAQKKKQKKMIESGTTLRRQAGRSCVCS